ncbi:hypothetical protein AB0O52_20270 [Arthrobacter sp. NPDC080073]|uniref:hypothetical protein n=1 Tax=Arthrobacter sp. NPDC080073 TaxID=3155919 RepID=UPI003425F448
MGLRHIFWKSRARADRSLPAAARIGPEHGEQTPEKRAELEQARAAFAQAAEGAGATSFRARTRNGTSSWEEDPATVRALAAALRHYRADGAAAPERPRSADQ